MQPMFDGQPMLCGPGWYEYGSSCYLVDTTDPSTWQTASENCTAMGAHLAVITDAAENTFIVNLMTSLNMESEVFWLGGNDIAVEGTHVWETTEPFNFTYSFDIGSGNTAMDCICVVQFYGWYDRFCTEAWYHVCVNANLVSIDILNGDGQFTTQTRRILQTQKMYNC
ncbi:CLC6A-like protein [Mya arenaria]|uniref:CLC6A-like protein n=1 Tax=Mya arenaria TaxID=6604 RepID=A0ABY7FW39_MYAAR|nr:CLC6A-like protein [Mya arenaria]